MSTEGQEQPKDEEQENNVTAAETNPETKEEGSSGKLQGTPTLEVKPKSLGNTDTNAATKNVKDIVFFGNGDTFKLICKASSKAEGWMKSTKAMEIKNLGCVVQVTTQQGSEIAEALTFVPGARIKETLKENKVVSRELILLTL